MYKNFSTGRAPVKPKEWADHVRRKWERERATPARSMSMKCFLVMQGS
jgi:hypothetical protein